MVKRFVLFVPPLAAALLLAVVSATAELGSTPRGIAVFLLTAAVVAALVPRRIDVRSHASSGLAIMAVTATGQTKSSTTYAVGCVVFALVVIACFRVPHRATRQAEAPTRRGAIAVLAGVVTLVTGFFVWSLPPAGRWLERQVQRYAGGGRGDAVGFATKIRIGGLHRMLQSDAVVMHVEGESPPLLRGVVLDRYDMRTWSSTLDESRIAAVAVAPLERTTTRVITARAGRYERSLNARWFLPADACDVRTDSGRIAIDGLGVGHPDPANDVDEIRFRSGVPCVERLRAPAPPRPVDLSMALKIRADLTPIALEWTRGQTTDRGRIEALERRLASFRYSLEDRREGHIDPVVEFLTSTRAGSCELFSSALALLARAIGIPARIAVGYQLHERNPITGLTVVRDRNAHQWVEVWLDDAWSTRDPTPVNETFMKRSSAVDHTFEAASWFEERAAAAFSKISLWQIGVGLAIVAAVLIVIRRLTRGRARAAARTTATTSRPLPAFEALDEALRGAGIARDAAEPLERFAERVQASGEPWSSDVADAMLGYAALRYGGHGEEPNIARRLDALARRVARARVARA